MTQVWFAFVQGPNGTVWEGTARMATGQDAENKARRLAQQKFCYDLVGQLIKDPPYGLWDSARASGFKCVAIEVEETT